MEGRALASGGEGSFSSGADGDVLSLLARSMLFEGMEPGSIARLLEGRCELVSFAKGEVIYSPSRYRRSLGILLAGRAEVTKSGQEGRQVAMNLLTPPMAFGVAALFHPVTEYVTQVTALADSQVLFISQEQLEEIFQLDYGTVRRYIAFLSGRICFLNRRIDAFTTVGAPQRLAAFLADSAQPAGGRRCQAGVCSPRPDGSERAGAAVRPSAGPAGDSLAPPLSAAADALAPGQAQAGPAGDGASVKGQAPGRPERKAGSRSHAEGLDGRCRGHGGDCWQFLLPQGMTGLSHMLNMGRASLYRAFDALAAQGLVRREGKVLWIPDRDALRRAASVPEEGVPEELPFRP